MFRMGNKLKFILVCIILCVLFLSFGGIFLVRDDKVADLASLKNNCDIVLLMGSLTDRTLGAYDLFVELDANNVYIMRTHMEGIELFHQKGITIDNQADLAKKALMDLGLAEDAIIVIDGDTESTRDEANALAKYFLNNGHSNNLIVMTSKYHSRRSGWIFDKALSKSDVNVYVSPTAYDNFDKHFWFTDREQMADVVLEYIKIFHFVLIEQWK